MFSPNQFIRGILSSMLCVENIYKNYLFLQLSPFFNLLCKPFSPTTQINNQPEIRIVQKLLMSLNRRYKSIVSIIEETRDLDVLKVEEVIASVKVFDKREDL